VQPFATYLPVLAAVMLAFVQTSAAHCHIQVHQAQWWFLNLASRDPRIPLSALTLARWSKSFLLHQCNHLLRPLPSANGATVKEVP